MQVIRCAHRTEEMLSCQGAKNMARVISYQMSLPKRYPANVF
jgi:hypothetical protein